MPSNRTEFQTLKNVADAALILETTPDLAIFECILKPLMFPKATVAASSLRPSHAPAGANNWME